MRCATIGVALAVGCGPRVPGTALPELEQANLIPAETFNARIEGLRATLARSRVELDTGPKLEFCGEHHGTSSCMHCDVAARTDTANVDPEMIDGVAIAFGRYPTAVIRAAGLERVALCRRIRYDSSGETPPAGVAIAGEHRLLISIEHFVGRRHGDDSFTIEQVVHHELFHLLDHARLGATAIFDREWAALNPPGFEYRAPADESTARPRGFVSSYATTNGLEDRASTFEYLMGHPTQLCELAEQDPILAAKIAVVWKRTKDVMGESLLRRHAPCWADRKTKKTTPKQRPFGPTKPERPPSLLGKMR